ETEVTLFAVDPSAQGLGYGRALMDQFVAACWGAGAARITVETDRESSFGFYDRYGFEVVGGFHSPMTALFSGGRGDSFVYELTV
ncbi:MAG: GNAT family N-acetyltransferase, partial [Actinomycetota bacterium]